MAPRTPDRRIANLLVVTLLVSVVAFGTLGAATTNTESTASFETMNETVRVHATDAATIHGTTDLEPNTTIGVRLQSTTVSDEGFIKIDRGSVAENGDFTATFNFTEQTVGDEFTAILLLENGTQIAETGGRVVAEDVAVTPTSETTQSTTDQTSETTEPTTEPTSENTSNGTSPGFGVLAAVLAIGVVVLSGRR